MPDCNNCTEKCPQAERALETALGRMYATQELVELVKKIEAGELVEVIRCRECTRFNPCKEIEGVSWTGWCNYGEFHTDEEDFCSRGERRADA